MFCCTLNRHSIAIRTLLLTILILFSCLLTSRPISHAQQVAQPQAVIRLFDAENSNQLSGPFFVTYFKDGRPTNLTVSGDTIVVPNIGFSPIETLRIYRSGFQPVAVKQLEGNQNDELNLVLWPGEGPKTLDRVFEMLLTYERIYYDYGLDFSNEGRNRWSQVQLRYFEAIRGMPHPASLATDNKIKQEWAVHKYNDIVHIFMPPNAGAFGQMSHNHCPCARARCCWCGRRK